MEIKYTQIEADQEEIDKRLSRAFDILFKEVIRIRGVPTGPKLEQEISTK